MTGRRQIAGRLLLALAAVLTVAIVGAWISSPGPDCTPEYGTGTVTLVDQNGSTLASVAVRIADTDCARYVGLSRTSSLAPGEGMLFVHATSGQHTYVMREMSFPLDIIFVSESGRVTTIHHAPVPSATPGEDLRRYRGRGRYVLEVPRGYANQTGLDVGDSIRGPDHAIARQSPRRD
jgi:hypothetical protein